MSLYPLYGHETARTQLAGTIRSSRLPQVLLVTGPHGVGKQRLALWLAQMLYCEARDSEPCGTCRGCQQVLNLTHPDLHWFVPLPRPKPGDHDKQIDEVAEMLEAAMAERRASGVWSSPDGMALHGVSAARLLQRKASLTSVEGGWRVFIIGHAERLVPQESSHEAANSLLKLLEEPPARSLFVLTAIEPGLVLPTIRSRSMPVRLGRLAAAEVRDFLSKAQPVAAIDTVVERARGSIGDALSQGDELHTKAWHAAEEFLRAAGEGPTRAAERALRQGPWQARGEFTALLDAIAERLSAAARSALLPGARVPHSNPGGALAGVEKVLEARERAQGNVNPQLLLAALANDLVVLEAV